MPRLRSTWLPLLCFTAGLIVTAALLRAVTPERHSHLDELAAEGESFDTVFVGSSHMLGGLDPRAFDAAMRTHGVETKSYVFALQGMTFPHLSYQVERILSLDLPALKRIVIEPLWMDRKISGIRQRENRSVVDWHDGSRTRMLVASALLSDEAIPERIERILIHLRIFLGNRVRFGMGREVLANLLGQVWLDPDERERARWVRERGYRPLFVEENQRRHRRFIDSVEPYRREVELYRRSIREMSTRTPDHPQVRFKVREVQGLIDEIAAAGILPVVLVFPSVDETIHYFDEDGVRAQGAVLSFDDPDAHPEMYSADWRIDRQHFHSEGAIAFSTRVAAELAPLLAKTPR